MFVNMHLVLQNQKSDDVILICWSVAYKTLLYWCWCCWLRFGGADRLLHFEKNILCFRNLSKILIVHSCPRLAQTRMFTHFFNNRFRFFPFKAIDYWYHGWQTGCGDTIVHNMIISMSPPTAPRSTKQKQINTRNNYLLGLLPLVSYCSKVIFSPWNNNAHAFRCF